MISVVLLPWAVKRRPFFSTKGGSVVVFPNQVSELMANELSNFHEGKMDDCLVNVEERLALWSTLMAGDALEWLCGKDLPCAGTAITEAFAAFIAD